MLAFLISAHTDPLQLKRLIEALPDDSRFFVHVDSHADISSFTSIISDSRVIFTPKRVHAVWGSFMQVRYQMILIEAALKAKEHFDYFITLSGLDYPLWTKDSIAQFFREAEGKEFIMGNDLSAQDAPSRLYRQYRFLAEKPWKDGSLYNKLRVAIRKLLPAIGIRKSLSFTAAGKQYLLHKGSSWWAITPDLAKHILYEYNTNKELVSYFRTSFGPDETFSQTIAFNSPEFRDRCIAVEGGYPGLAALTPLTYIYYDPVIKILSEEDFNTLKASGKMFARKLVSGKSDRLIRMLPLND